MALITWDYNLSVNIKEIDEQHKSLIKIINQLHEAMLNHREKAVLGKIIDELLDYTEVHFSFEEKNFHAFNYPYKMSHISEHNKFVYNIQDFKKGFDEGQVLLSLEIMNYLKEWIVRHFQVTDKRFSDFFNEKGLKFNSIKKL